MKQVFNDLRSGQIRVVDAPSPNPSPTGVLVQTRASLISTGTERMLVEFGQASLIGKARAQPEKVKQVLEKIRADGLLPTLDSVFTRLDEPLPLGYCNAGIVLEVGREVTTLSPGDRVASNGSHAELVAVSRTLCAKIPDQVTDEQAAFAPLASVGLQGIRLAAPTLGEHFVVIGLGLVGLLTVQLLRANGCAVLGLDPNARRLALAEQYGATVLDVSSGVDPVTGVMDWSGGRGADGVLIAASSKGDEILHQSAAMCRKRGRVVLLGVVGLNLRRADFYEKELNFQVSCSYGPGRYDETYENRGQDYPLGFVRWTEQRNFEAVLEMLASHRIDVEQLVSHRFPIVDASSAYDTLGQEPDAMGVVLQYSETVERAVRVATAPVSLQPGKACLAVVGAGNFSKMTLMPALTKTSARVKYVCDLSGGAAANLARKHHVEQAVTDHRLILNDPDVTGVIFAVGHEVHAKLVAEALAAGKHVLVEKPLALSVSEVQQLNQAVTQQPDRLVMVGFNRRFSPYAVRMKDALGGRTEPLAMNITVNAGIIPANHWVHDPHRGGGRIVGEACHFIDLMVYLTGSKVSTVSACMMGSGPGVRDDKMVIALLFGDGSIGSLSYFANGSKSYPKERVEVFSEGRVLRLTNFKRLEGWGFRAFRPMLTLRHEKGHAEELRAFVHAIETGGTPLIPWGELVNVTLASFAALSASREQRTVSIDREYSDLLTTG